MSFSNNQEFVVSKIDKAIGMILVVGIIIVFFAYISYEEKNLKNRWLTLKAYTTDSYSLTDGAAILLSGVNIGKIDHIDLAEDGRVQLTLLLDKHYQSFYVRDSSLNIDSNLDINTIFSGSNLLFNKGYSGVLLKENDTIVIKEPKSVTKIIEQWDVQEVVSNLSVVVDNLVVITSSLKEKKDSLDDTISNINSATMSINQASGSLPLLLDSSRLMIEDMRLSLAQVKPEITSSLRSVEQTMSDSQQLFAKFDTLVDSLNSVSHQVPKTFESTNLALYEIRILSRKLNNHWLINQGQPNDNIETPQLIPTVLPQDKSLYQNNKTIQD